jgi:CheY-like chemotaxis protein
MVDSVLRTVDPFFADLRIDVENTIPLGLPRLDVQLIPVQEALVNLLLLAARSTSAGRIQISAEASECKMRIHIVSERVDSAKISLDKDERESLEMARKLVEFSGGRIGVLTAHPRMSALAIEVVLPTEEQITVLAIDDNPDTLRLMQRYVSGTRYNLIGIQDPEQALALLESATNQIVILDVMLPNTDGWAFLRRLRADSWYGDIPVVICTVLPQEQLALAHGATAFLRKPISRNNFLAVLDSQVELLRR